MALHKTSAPPYSDMQLYGCAASEWPNAPIGSGPSQVQHTLIPNHSNAACLRGRWLEPRPLAEHPGEHAFALPARHALCWADDPDCTRACRRSQSTHCTSSACCRTAASTRDTTSCWRASKVSIAVNPRFRRGPRFQSDLSSSDSMATRCQSNAARYSDDCGWREHWAGLDSARS